MTGAPGSGRPPAAPPAIFLNRFLAISSLLKSEIGALTQRQMVQFTLEWRLAIVNSPKVPSEGGREVKSQRSKAKTTSLYVIARLPIL